MFRRFGCALCNVFVIVYDNSLMQAIVIGAKEAEGNYLQLSEDVCGMIKEYNGLLCHSMSGVATETSSY